MSGYIDDFFPKGDTFLICEENIHKTMRLCDKLGFAINLKKSQIVPTQRVRILGFLIDSVKMIVALTEGKKQKLKTLVRKCYRDAEWMLNPEIFQKAIKHLKFKPDLDCFASRLNTQLPKYISCKPDPYAYLIDAF